MNSPGQDIFCVPMFSDVHLLLHAPSQDIIMSGYNCFQNISKVDEDDIQLVRQRGLLLHNSVVLQLLLFIDKVNSLMSKLCNTGVCWG